TERHSAREPITFPSKTRSALSAISSNEGATTEVAFATLINNHIIAQTTTATLPKRMFIKIQETAGETPLIQTTVEPIVSETSKASGLPCSCSFRNKGRC